MVLRSSNHSRDSTKKSPYPPAHNPYNQTTIPRTTKMNDLKDFPQGFYTLNQDTQNPKPDRRKKDSIPHQSTWKKGTRFQIKHFPHLPPRLQTPQGNPIEFQDQIQAILPNLSPAPLAAGQITDQFDAPTILALAVQNKLLNLKQIQELQEQFQQLNDQETESLMQFHWFWNKI